MSSQSNTIYEILKAPQTVFTPTLIAQLVQEIDNLSLIPIQDLSKNFSKFDELIDNAQGDKINKLMVLCLKVRNIVPQERISPKAHYAYSKDSCNLTNAVNALHEWHIALGHYHVVSCL